MRCKILDCKNLASAKEKCGKHLAQERSGHEPIENKKTKPSVKCEVKACSIDAIGSAGYCNSHYQKAFRGEDPEEYEVPNSHSSRRKCWVSTCPKPTHSKGLCQNHAKQARTGRIDVPEELGVRVNGPCAFEGCNKPYSSNKLCHSHDSQRRLGKDLTPLKNGVYARGEQQCAKPECHRPATSRDLCKTHYPKLVQYNLTTEQFVEVWENSSKCANEKCANTKNLVMDHDHKTGDFRDLLCAGCNSALGFLKENPERIKGLAGYIERFPHTQKHP